MLRRRQVRLFVGRKTVVLHRAGSAAIVAPRAEIPRLLADAAAAERRSRFAARPRLELWLSSSLVAATAVPVTPGLMRWSEAQLLAEARMAQAYGSAEWMVCVDEWPVDRTGFAWGIRRHEWAALRALIDEKRWKLASVRSWCAAALDARLPTFPESGLWLLCDPESTLLAAFGQSRLLEALVIETPNREDVLKDLARRLALAHDIEAQAQPLYLDWGGDAGLSWIGSEGREMNSSWQMGESLAATR